MTTTIQVEESTLELLRQLKKAKQLKSYDEVVKSLINDKKISLWGFLGKQTLQKILGDLRDEKDRL